MALARAATTLRLSGPLNKVAYRDIHLLAATPLTAVPQRHLQQSWQRAKRQQKGISTATLRVMAVGKSSQGKETATLALGCFWEPV